MEHEHAMSYLILVLGLGVAALFFVLFKYNPTYQILSAALGSLYYSGWGIVHHHIEGRLTRIISLEYVLFGLIVFLLLFASLNLS